MRRVVQRVLGVQPQQQQLSQACLGATPQAWLRDATSLMSGQSSCCSCSSSSCDCACATTSSRSLAADPRWSVGATTQAAPRVVAALPSGLNSGASAHIQWRSIDQLRSHGMRGFASEAGAKSNTGEEAAPPGGAEAAQEQKQEASGPEQGDQEAAAVPSVEQLTADLQKKTEEAAQLVGQVEKLTDQLKRSLAEMENVRMRAARDVDTAKKFAVQGFIKNLLDVADNLERAAGAVPADALAEDAATDAAQLRKLLKGLLEGVSATEKIFLHVLKLNGVEQYNPLGQKFDPNLHNALFELPDPSKEVGSVAAVTKRGYKMHDRVIRPADVGVVRAP